MANDFEDKKVNNLVINRMSRETYNQLSAIPGKLSDYELYLIDDEVIDSFNKRIVNVEVPVDDNDATNKIYVDENFLQKNSIANEVFDYSKTYSKVTSQHQNGETYIDGAMNVFEKNNSKIHVSEIIKGDLKPEDINIIWTSHQDGEWAVEYNGNQYYTGNTNKLTEDFYYESDDKTIKFKISPWMKVDTLVRFSDIKNKLETLGNNPTVNDLIDALKSLA